MKVAKKILPVFLALMFMFGMSYYLFSVYKPIGASQVKGTKTSKSNEIYLDTIPLPADSKELGRIIGDGFEQVTVSSLKTNQEVQKFFRSVLISKGWKTADSVEELLSVTYKRDQERIEVSVLSVDDELGTVFSLSYFD